MIQLTAIQWAGVALIAAGLLWWLAPQIRQRVAALWPAAGTEPEADPILDRYDDADHFVTLCWRLDSIQDRLEELGHEDLTRALDEVYPSLRTHSLQPEVEEEQP